MSENTSVFTPRFVNSASSDLAKVLDHIKSDRKSALDRVFDLLRIPSISARSEHNTDVEDAAQFVAADLNTIGFQAKVHETKGKPLIIAHNFDPTSTDETRNPKNIPHVIFYGHYDVQPAEPLDEWIKAPFEPYIQNNTSEPCFVARGACDDKGQMMTFIEAFRAWYATHNAYPLRISVVVEGEEEVGSLHVEEAVLQHSHLFGDVQCAFVCDTEMWNQSTPAITTRLRGLLYEEIQIFAANRDLHSGLYGGIAQNAARVLTKILGNLHDENGKIQIPEFYDDVIDPDKDILTQGSLADFDWKGMLAKVDLELPAGENTSTPLEQLWYRPTADINGVITGYTAEGSKTVIPAKASAKVSFRLAAGQDAQKIQSAFRKWVEGQLPADCSVSFKNFAKSAAISVPENGKWIKASSKALSDQWQTEPVLGGCGASIPIVEIFSRALGLQVLLIGFALPENGMHSPNENYSLTSFHGACESWVRIIDEIAK